VSERESGRERESERERVGCGVWGVACGVCAPEIPRVRGSAFGVQGFTPLAIDATIRRGGEQFCTI